MLSPNGASSELCDEGRRHNMSFCGLSAAHRVLAGGGVRLAGDAWDTLA